MRNFLQYSTLFTICVLLLGCSTSISDHSLLTKKLYNDKYFPQFHSIYIESEADIFAIDDEMKEMIRTKILTEKDLIYRAKKLRHHLFSQDNINLTYQTLANVTATKAYHSQMANCLSLTIMSYVLAKEAGLDVEFRNVKIPEYWVRNQQYNMRTTHVNLLVKIPVESSESIIWNNTLVIDFDPFEARNYFHKKTIDKSTILAMFYTNKGAEAIITEEYSKAYAYLKKATIVDPKYPASWSNLAILYRMIKNVQLAEQTYRYALSLDPNNLTILNNLAMLMKRQGFIDKSLQIEKSIHNQRIKNPYYHALLGDEALYQGNGSLAKSHYKKAIKLNNKNHEFYYGLAKAYYQLDDYLSAQVTLEKAIKLNKVKSTEHQYIAKLEWMKASAINDY